MTTRYRTQLRPMQKRFQRWWEFAQSYRAAAANDGDYEAVAIRDVFWAAWQAAERSGVRLGIEQACEVLDRPHDERAIAEEVDRIAEEVRGMAPFRYKPWEIET